MKNNYSSLLSAMRSKNKSTKKSQPHQVNEMAEETRNNNDLNSLGFMLTYIYIYIYIYVY